MSYLNMDPIHSYQAVYTDRSNIYWQHSLFGLQHSYYIGNLFDISDMKYLIINWNDTISGQHIIRRYLNSS